MYICFWHLVVVRTVREASYHALFAALTSSEEEKNSLQGSLLQNEFSFWYMKFHWASFLLITNCFTASDIRVNVQIHTRSEEEWTFPWLFNKNTSTCWLLQTSVHTKIFPMMPTSLFCRYREFSDDCIYAMFTRCNSTLSAGINFPSL